MRLNPLSIGSHFNHLFGAGEDGGKQVLIPFLSGLISTGPGGSSGSAGES